MGLFVVIETWLCYSSHKMQGNVKVGIVIVGIGNEI